MSGNSDNIESLGLVTPQAKGGACSVMELRYEAARQALAECSRVDEVNPRQGCRHASLCAASKGQ
jgi:hypothetical protein